ncbi:MAG: hypothetical protein J6Y52_06750 [Bacteroidales bacterium]|nr:hypothetical protein [Bacteroidales bacterium]MBR6440726.1 hypothetical protein [Bacteroidales bacterium]
MKKALFLIVATLLLCNEMKAQDLAVATNTLPSFQTSLVDIPQTDVTSIYTLPMPASDLAVNNNFNTQQYASQKGWGIACIVAGGVTLLGGASVWLFGGIFSTATTEMGGTDPDPDLQQAQNIGNGIKTAGIIGTAAGAVLVGTGIVLIATDKGSSRGHRSKRGHRRSHRRRFSDNMPTYEDLQPDWGLCLNVSPTSAGLSFSF